MNLIRMLSFLLDLLSKRTVQFRPSFQRSKVFLIQSKPLHHILIPQSHRWVSTSATRHSSPNGKIALQQNLTVFQKFGRTDKVTHQIKLSDETQFKHRPTRIHPQDINTVRKHLQELLESGVIRESNSPFSSPIVVVRKKNGSMWLYQLQKLNLQTIKDAYALPKLENTFTALSGSEWFSVLDLKAGYKQIEMDEADKSKTTFVCPLGFWEFNRMPQGVTNALSTFYLM